MLYMNDWNDDDDDNSRTARAAAATLTNAWCTVTTLLCLVINLSTILHIMNRYAHVHVHVCTCSVLRSFCVIFIVNFRNKFWFFRQIRRVKNFFFKNNNKKSTNELSIRLNLNHHRLGSFFVLFYEELRMNFIPFGQWCLTQRFQFI